MGIMNKTLHESQTFRLKEVRHRKQKHGPPMYQIVWHNWRNIPVSEERAMRDMVDPKRNISSDNASSWRFRDRKTAERKYLMLVMRWL
jgi:hypothetical protein